MIRLVQTLIALIASALIAAAPAVAAKNDSAKSDASSDGTITITEIDTKHYPDVWLGFSVNSKSTKLPKVTLSESANGKMKEIRNVAVNNGRIGIRETAPKPVLILAIDASDSMRGEKFEAAKAAALELVDQARDGDRIGIVAFGKESEKVLSPTSDKAKIEDEINGLELSKGTALYDGLIDAANAFPEDSTRNIVVLLSDGADVGSKASEQDVIDVSRESDVEIHSVGIKGKDFSPDSIASMANATGGKPYEVASTQELEPLFEELGTTLLRGFWLEYRSSQPASSKVEVYLEVGYEVGTLSYSTPSFANPDGSNKYTEPEKVKTSDGLVPLPDGPIGALIATLPFGLLLALYWLGRSGKKNRLNLSQRIKSYTEVQQQRIDIERKEKRTKSTAFLNPLFKTTETFFGRSKLFVRLRFLLEMANIPLREVEILYIMAGAGLLLSFVMLLIIGPIGMVIGFIIGAFMPFMWLKMKAKKRSKLFDEQLADVLNTIAQSLKAGHSFNQALNAIIKDAPAPTSEEFSRVMTETRLGLPMDDALEAMAVRMGSADFDFAVTTVNIQRTVGGSLAEILEMVGDTVRGRQQFRKKVKALTSMGRMSAYVLLAMPVFIGLVITMMSPEYMAPMISTTPGYIMIAIACGSMFLGYLACMKIVSIKI